MSPDGSTLSHPRLRVYETIRRIGTLALIVSVFTACDNVEWAGATMELRPPPKPDPVPVDSVPGEDEPLPPPLPDGPILGVVEMEGDRARLIPVGEVTAGGLVPLASDDTLPGFTERLAAERLGPGTEYDLFYRGVPVGRFAVDQPAISATGFCFDVPAASGFVEVAPSAAGTRRFLAMPSGSNVGLPRGTEPPPTESTRGMRINTLRLFGEQITANRARWPQDVAAARRDLQLLDLGRGNSAALASTFLFRDGLTVGAPAAGAYSMFILAENPAAAYNAEYVWYRRADQEGKGIPRLLDALDYDGDGGYELVLEVLGADDRWFAVVEEQTGTWTRSFQHPCGEPGVQVRPEAPSNSTP